MIRKPPFDFRYSLTHGRTFAVLVDIKRNINKGIRKEQSLKVS